MRRFIIPLLCAVVGIIFAGCVAPAEAPPTTPTTPPTQPTAPTEPTTPATTPEPTNPYEGLAIKPDGTPYRFASLYVLLSVDTLVNHSGQVCSLIERAGGEYTELDADFDVQKQIDQVDDMIALQTVDGIFIEACEEDMLVPVCEKAEEAGITVIEWDLKLHSDKVTSVIYHDFEGESGTNLIGEYLVQRAKDRGEQLQVFVGWCLRDMEMQWERYRGFMRPVDANPQWVNIVMESAETFGSNELTAEYVMDGFTAHPEMNAMYVICGGGSGAPEGLRAIDRLQPYGHADHVITCLNDCDIVPVEQMDAGNIDAFLSHPNPDLGDVGVKIMFEALILGQSVPQKISLPMWLITPENIEMEKYGAPGTWPRMIDKYGPDWDNWPILDTSELGIRTPTTELRMQYQGY